MSAPNVVATAACDLLEAGWNPIALPPRSKKPNRAGWQNERCNAADVQGIFLPDLNIGVLLGNAGNGRVDVDCDCLEAIKLAPEFLPQTDFIHGRPSRRASHYWYTGDPVPEHKKFEDVNGDCLVELRAVGQTVVPPSVHPTGEELSWDAANGMPATVAGESLSLAVRELAAATLITRHYPNAGSRHEFALAFAGFLLRQGWNVERVKRFVVAVATAAGDEEISDREKAVETTAERFAAKEKIVGGPSVRDIVGNPVFERFAAWLGFGKPASFVLPTIEAAKVAPDETPAWPIAALNGDYITELSYWLNAGTAIPPQFVREQIVLVLAALADGNLGYPRHPDLVLRRYLALISERAQSCKGESWKRITANTALAGALLSLISAGGIKLQDGSGIGSGQFLAAQLEQSPRMICFWDEGSQLFQVSGQQNSTVFSAMKTLYESNSYHSGSFTNRAHGTNEAHFTALLHSTRKTFVDGFSLSRGASDGLLSRFTLAYSAGIPVMPEWEPRNLNEEKTLLETVAKLLPKAKMVPAISDDARECMNEFIRKLGAPDHPYPDHVRRLPELAKIDVLHRCIYSESPQIITLDMVERSIAWGEHQLALRLAFWPPDAKSETASMTKVILNRLRKGSASARDLRKSTNVDRDGTHELFNRCLSALLRSRMAVVLGKNGKGYEIYGLDEGENV
jgi:Bifunctional DNA primase/polymerase, N-terminal